jgi:dihydrofolate reductase
MQADRSTLTLHVVCSLDGFIAKRDNSVGWMDSPPEVYEKGVAENEGNESITPIDCFVLGSRTYEHALELGWPYGDLPTIVLTRRTLPSSKKTVEFWSREVSSLLEHLTARGYRSVWMVGGAAAAKSFLQADLVEEIRLMVAPVILGGGLRLFGEDGVETRWMLKDLVGYRNGFVSMVYRRVRPRQ